MSREANKRLGPMIFWAIAIAITVIACAALFYAAAGRVVNASGPELADPNNHFRLLLAGIEADLASGKLDEEQANVAKGELAREMLRTKGDAPKSPPGELGHGTLLAGLGVIAAISLGLYAVLGSPELPTHPLAQRPEIAAQSISLEDAIAQIEERLAAVPNDLRGWTVIAPAYVELGRYADAANAYRQAITLSEPSAELQTSLAEALLLDAGEAGSGEALDLLRQAAASDPSHIRSRLYLAAESMRIEDYGNAADYWRAAIDLANGDEAWLPAAQQGLAVAEADGVDDTAEQQAEMIRAMVGSLAERLASDGGDVEEWTQLVQSYLVLGEQDNAQTAYDAAVAAYPAAFDRGELDTLALAAGLTLNGATP
ncbi:c-type cytochrome biogenesis protein CcmI [Devosia sp. YIM 151766]|uniref:c-type cytochrome biogenesis protein CcmI n=1 Tax=Devosia sp. YIM 151766 TaxID=3017325 RepID=UPI00255CC8AA|nr:c-type cytochrome biogenesis protein CcmI [Devosia sp. YIM 151766]WIY53687.1 c-type cytochrome biogenesis protein CcmI [Devosia sp. YIM 151766]